LRQREITVRAKPAMARIVRFGYQAAQTLDRYLRVRARHEQAWRPQLCLGTNNRGPLTPSGIYHHPPRLPGRRGGLPAPVPASFQPHLAGPGRPGGRPDGAERLVLAQMLRRYGASARRALARRTYDRIMADQP
jgi:hypothetical protein